MKIKTGFFNTSPYSLNYEIKLRERYQNKKLSRKEKQVLRMDLHYFNADILLMPGLTREQQDMYLKLAAIVQKQFNSLKNLFVCDMTTGDEKKEAFKSINTLPPIYNIRRIAQSFTSN